MTQTIYALAILGAGTVLGAALVACYYAGKAAGYKVGEKKGFIQGIGTGMDAFNKAMDDAFGRGKK